MHGQLSRQGGKDREVLSRRIPRVFGEASMDLGKILIVVTADTLHC